MIKTDYAFKSGWLKGSIKTALYSFKMSDELRKHLEQSLEDAEKESRVEWRGIDE